MDKKLALALSGLFLVTGCVAVPVEPAPVVYAAPPPPAAVVVRPYASYGYYYRGGPYWRRHWR